MKESILDVHLEKCRAKSNLLRMLTLLLFALCTTTVFAQQKNIRGTVIDASGDPPYWCKCFCKRNYDRYYNRYGW